MCASAARITDITKDATAAKLSVGELVGITKISADVLKRLAELAEREPAAEYETGGLARLAADYPLSFTLVPDLVWAEIDTPAHFERVRRVVYPRLVQRESTSGQEGGRKPL